LDENFPVQGSSDETTQPAYDVRQLMAAAVNLDREARPAFLDRVCGSNGTLRRELERLLAHHEATTDSQLSGLGANFTGRQIGPYTVVRQLGHGGMGTVYLVERTIGRHRQQLALKLVQPGLTDNDLIIRRFEHEREILASLDHPNIAHLLDIGSTGDGVPYLVMDYVNGQPIDDYCDQHRLSIDSRLTLFLSVCAAIQYAHSKGVVHRDIKPGNILITPEGIVKLLDFGIAKVLNSPGQTQVLLTQSGMAPMTIEYASPEQIRGQTAGPASDVYSLGVVLYELLTGLRPHRVENRPPHAILSAICEEPPQAPSSVMRRHNDLQQVCDLRGQTPQRLIGLLAGDLDSILLKALRKQPEWRYASAEEFSADIGRHRMGLRVTARKDTLLYRAERALHRILHPTDDVFHSHGLLMLTAGLLAILLLLERQFIHWRWVAEAAKEIDIIAVGGWLCWSMFEGRSRVRAGEFSSLDRRSWIVFTVITVALGTLTIASAISGFIPPHAMAVFWNTGLAIGLLAMGLQANRIMTAGGVVLLSSALTANLLTEWAYLSLAAGMLGGMVIPGIIFTIQKRNFKRADRPRDTGSSTTL
jgi:serine/threonine protein kinase